MIDWKRAKKGRFVYLTAALSALPLSTSDPVRTKCLLFVLLVGLLRGGGRQLHYGIPQ